MPSVPQYGQPQVQEQALPNVRVGVDAPAEAFGGGASRISDAAGGFAKQVHDIAVQEKQKADEVAVTEAWNRTVQKKNELLYHPEKGAINRRGKNAFGVTEEYGGEFDKFADGVTESLSNPEQRAFYEKMRGRVRGDLEENLTRHTFQEGEKFEQATFESTISTLEDDAIQNYHQTGKVTENVGLLRAQIESYAAKKGMPAEWVKDKTNERAAGVYSGIISRMLANGQDIKAKELYDDVKKTVSFGKSAASIEANLEEGSTRGESQRITDNILKEYGDLTAAREAVRLIKDPKLRDAVDDRVKMEYGLMAQRDQVNRTKNFMDSYAAVEKSKDWQSIPPAQWNALLPGQKTAIKLLAKQSALGEDPVHDDKVYVKYGMSMPDGQLAKVTEAELIEKVKPYVRRQYFDEILHRWGRVTQAANSPKAKMEAKSIYNDNEMIIEVMKANKIGGIERTDSKSDIEDDADKANAVARMKDLRDQAVFSFTEKNGGKPPNDKQTKEILNDLVLRKVYVKNTRFGFDSLSSDDQVVAAVASPEQLKKAYVPMATIPPRAKTELVNRARAQGHIAPGVSDERALVVLKDNIERAYAARAAGMGLDVVDSILSEN